MLNLLQNILSIAFLTFANPCWLFNILQFIDYKYFACLFYLFFVANKGDNCDKNNWCYFFIIRQKSAAMLLEVKLALRTYFSNSVPISKKDFVYLKGFRFRAMYTLASFSISCLVLTLFAYIHSSISSFLKNSFLPNL